MQQHAGYVPSADDQEHLKLDAKELLKRPVPDINWDLPPTTNVSSKKAKTAVTELPQPTLSSEETASSVNKVQHLHPETAYSMTMMLTMIDECKG
jgi:hypothetical protein